MAINVDVHDYNNTLPWGPPAEPWSSFQGGPAQFPLNGDSEIDGEAQRLWQAYWERVQHVATVEQGAKDATEAIHIAHSAYLAEVERAAEAGEVSTLDQELMAKRDACEKEVLSGVHEKRKRAAQDLAYHAEQDYLRFINDHAFDFVAEVEAEGVKVAAEYRKIHDETRKRLAPLEQRHQQIRAAVRFFVGDTEPFTLEDLPEDPGVPPLPTEESLQRYAAFHAPAEPDIDHSALAATV